MNDNKKIINYSEIGRRLGYDRNLIRSKKWPDKYDKMMDELNKFIDQWAKKHLK